MRNQRGDGKETTPFVDSVAVQRQNGERQRFCWQLIGSFASAKASAAQNFWVKGSEAVQRAALPAGLPTTSFGQARQPALSLFSFMAFSSSGLGLSITEYLSPKKPHAGCKRKSGGSLACSRAGRTCSPTGTPGAFPSILSLLRTEEGAVAPPIPYPTSHPVSRGGAAAVAVPHTPCGSPGTCWRCRSQERAQAQDAPSARCWKGCWALFFCNY